MEIHRKSGRLEGGLRTTAVGDSTLAVSNFLFMTKKIVLKKYFNLNLYNLNLFPKINKFI